MDVARWLRVEKLYHATQDIEPELRRVLLVTLCDGDEESLKRVRSLLGAGRDVSMRGGPFPCKVELAKTPGSESPTSTMSSSCDVGAAFALPPDAPGAFVGPYKLAKPLGSGGMGTVYLAEQQFPLRRRVALKIIKPGTNTSQVIARFNAERQMLAIMDHPNIAKVLDAGATDTGQPYFVMELVEGTSITEYCDARRLTMVERLQLFIAVCQALQHAHQKGIIHRDLKPSNILVTEYDGKAIPKVIDFGIAKAMQPSPGEEADLTRADAIIGTLAYMSPEQAGGMALDLDTRSDIFSLGVTLYELLTGTTPLGTGKPGGVLATVRRIHEEVFPPPSARLRASPGPLATLSAIRGMDPANLLKEIPSDLDWIVMKALEKDRAQRYPTANSMARDLERYVNGDPVEAGPPSATYRVQKFVRKHRLALATAAAFALLLAIAVLVSTWQAVRASRERDRAVAAQRESTAEKLAAYAMENLEHDPEQSIILSMHAISATYQFQRAVLPAAATALHFALAASHTRLSLRGHRGPVLAVASSVNQKYLATASSDSTAKVWDAATGLCLRTLQHSEIVEDVAFSPDSMRVATASLDGTARVWNIAGGEELLTLRGHRLSVNSVAFSPDGKRLATAGADGTARLWDLRNGRELLTLRRPAEIFAKVSFSPDGKLLATTTKQGTATIWDLASEKEKVTFRGEDLAFSPDGRRVATVDHGTAKVWNVSTGRELIDLRHQNVIRRVAFSPDGKRLASPSSDNSIRIWDSDTGQEIIALHGHYLQIFSLAFVGDGSSLISGSLDRTARVWNLSGGGELLKVPGHEDRIAGLVFSSDGRHFLSASLDGTAKIWDTKTGKPLLVLRGHHDGVLDASYSLDGRRVVTAGGDGVAKIWDSATGRQFLSIQTHQLAVTGAFFSPDGKYLVTNGYGGSTKIWDAATGEQSFSFGGASEALVWARFSSNSKQVAIENSNGSVRVWETSTGRQLYKLGAGRRETKAAMAFSADGRRLARSEGDMVNVWDVSRSRQLAALRLPQGWTPALEFSPDSRLLVALVPTSDGDMLGRSHGGARIFRLWDTATGKELLTFSDPGLIGSVVFSPGGKQLATNIDKTVRLWDTVTGREMFTLGGDGARVISIAFSPDGRRLATGDSAGFMRMFALQVPDLLDIARGRVTRPLTSEECQRYFQSYTCPALP